MSFGDQVVGGDPGPESWRFIGPVSELSKMPCRVVHATLDRRICLFYINGSFFAMDARCAHSGGPLCEGDIEEVNGVLKVFCPWHDYDFSLHTGESQMGLKQPVFPVKVEDGSVYVKFNSPLSLTPLSAATKE
ncbi:Rieske domain-containing protein [Polypterus senegalus]|uniref:Rieske domain-containing protein n=1 Tax=Polypterus senegalus TaxID=55291 RepID=UPI0019643045|nr:Rieske domain-containing protein [Polypterus senegalus]